MKILVAGATGATGKLVVDQLLDRGHSVTALVRSPEKLSQKAKQNPDLSIIRNSLLKMTDREVKQVLENCDGAVSCLGHNLTLKVVFGPPRKLVRDSVMKIVNSIESVKRENSFRFVLMNTTGNRNRNLPEKLSMGETLVMALIRLLIPPQSDNEKAAEFLRTMKLSADRSIEWIAVRPDTLIDDSETSPYELFPSPQRSPIFNPGKTSRINVAHFMAELFSSDELWRKWEGQMPVIYNK